MTYSLDEIIDICSKYNEIYKDFYKKNYSRFSIGKLEPSTITETCEMLKAFNLNWGDKLILSSDFSITRKYYLVNSATKYKPQEETFYVVWDNGNVGVLEFVNDEYYYQAQDEWNEFIDKLLSYNPIDYDRLNDRIVYDIENGKKVMNDYFEIYTETKNKIANKIRKLEIEKKEERT